MKLTEVVIDSDSIIGSYIELAAKIAVEKKDILLSYMSNYIVTLMNNFYLKCYFGSLNLGNVSDSVKSMLTEDAIEKSAENILKELYRLDKYLIDTHGISPSQRIKEQYDTLEGGDNQIIFSNGEISSEKK